MIRVVLDTNILISAILTPQGTPAQVLLLCLSDPTIQLCMSAPVYAEYDEVIHRPKFKRTQNEISAILGHLRQTCIWVRPHARVQVCTDLDDNIFLECAQAAEANFIVTGNAKHFPTFWQRTQIVSAHQFTEEVS